MRTSHFVGLGLTSIKAFKLSIDKLAERRPFRFLVLAAVFTMGLSARLGAAYFIPQSSVHTFDLEVLRKGAVIALQGQDVYSLTLRTWSLDPHSHFFAYPAAALLLAVFLLKVSALTGTSFLITAQFAGAFLDVALSVVILVVLKRENFCKKTLAVLLMLFNPFTFSDTILLAKPDDALMLLASLGSLHFLETNRYVRGSFLYGVSLAIKQFPVLLLPYFLYHLPNSVKKVGGLSMATAFALFSLPFIVTEPLTYLQAAYVIHLIRGGEAANFYSPSAGLLTLWPNQAFLLAALLIFLGVVGLIYLQFIESNPYKFGLLMAFAFISFYWVLFQQYFSWFVPFLIISTMITRSEKANQRSSRKASTT